MSAQDVAQGVGAAPDNNNATPNADTRTLGVEELNKLVGTARIEGEKRANAALGQQIAEMQQQIAALTQGLNPQGQIPQQGQQPAANAQQPNTSDMQNPQVYEAVKQELANQQQQAIRAQQKQQISELLNTYDQEMKTGEEHYEDFKEVTGKFNPDDFPEIALMAAQLGNIPHVMYALNKDPGRLAAIVGLMQRSPHYAFEELKALAKSVNDNMEAKAKYANPIKPLTSVKASTAGTDNGRRSVTDWKKFYRNKR